MKKILGFILAVLPLLAFAAGPQIKFLETQHDFGNIKEKGGKVTTTFRFVNVGDAPLVILSASAACGCTDPSFEDAPVAPGDTSQITVTFNPKGKPGELNKTINIKSNSAKNSTSRLKIKGVVIPDHK